MTAICIRALRAQITEVLTRPVEGLHVSPQEDDFRCVDALVVGPEGTPYAGGFFHFDMKFPQDYPYRPPKVLLMTTDGKRVRFNPNLYANGRVCLSILGTWEGPGWKPVLTLTSVLLSIQSLMNEKPYHNEPGYEDEDPTASENYNARIRFETLRVAVCKNVEAVLDLETDADADAGASTGKGELIVERAVGTPGSRSVPADSQAAIQRFASKFRSQILSQFLKNYDDLLLMAEKESAKYDGKPFADPFGDMTGQFQYQRVLSKLKELKNRAEARMTSGNSDGDLSDSDSDSDESSVCMEGDEEFT